MEANGDIKQSHNSEGSFSATSIHRSSTSVITETCGVFITRSSEKRGRKFCTVKRNPLLLLICVQQHKNFPLLFKFPTILKQHLLSNSYKRLRPFWKTITIQWLENCSPSLGKKKKKADTAAATTDNKNFLLHNPCSWNDKETILTYPERMMCLIRGALF